MKEKIMNFIIGYIQDHDYPPSYREIAVGVGLANISSVHYYMEILFKWGLLETEVKGKSGRAYRVKGYKFVKE